MRQAILLLWLPVLFACSTLSKETETKSKLSFETKTFALESATGCTDEQQCARYEVTYPEFSGISPAAKDSLQRRIELVFSMGDPEANLKNMKQVAQEFVANYTAFSKELADGAMGWYYRGNATVNVITDTLLSIRIDDEYFTGGAHGGGGTYFINVDPTTGGNLTLASFFKAGYKRALAAAGEIQFRKARELKDTATYRFNGFEFPGDKFQLNDNYGFTPQGIVFVYNSYEIAPYALGSTELVIPWIEVKDWLK